MEEPRCLQIETHNYCNAKCVFCPVPKLERKRGFMSDELFKKIIDDAAENTPNVVHVYPFMNGEPFIDPKLLDRVAYINQKLPKTKVVLFSNCSLLTKELVDKMLTVKVAAIIVSLNAGNPEKYKEIMGLDFEQTIANVDYLVEKKPNNLEVTISIVSRPLPAPIRRLITSTSSWQAGRSTSRRCP